VFKYVQRFNKNRILKAVIDKSRHVAHRLKLSSKDKLRPYYRLSKKLVRRSKYASLLLISRRERRIYRSVRTAKSYEASDRWSDAGKIWYDLAMTTEGDPHDQFIVNYLTTLLRRGDETRALNEVEGYIAEIKPDKGNIHLTRAQLQTLLRLSRFKSDAYLTRCINNPKLIKSNIREYEKRKNKAKIAIVTAIAGSYDSLRPIVNVNKNVDYIVYSDQPIKVPNYYKLYPMPYVDSDTTRSARYVKTNLTKLLPEYDVIIWIDANIYVTGDIYSLISDFDKRKSDFAVMLHPSRLSLLDEMDECIRSGKDDAGLITEQREFYKSQNYTSNKLIESNILFIRNNAKSDKLMSLWWGQIDRFSRRDQLSINYSIDKSGVKWHIFTDRPITSRNHPAFALVDHGKGNINLAKLSDIIDSRLKDPMTNDASKRPMEIAVERIKTVTAVVCIHNAKDDVMLCLDSIKRHKHENLSIILIDDGSDKETKDSVREFYSNNKTWTTYIRHEIALGYTKSASEGMKKSKADLTFLLNSDTITTPNWSEKMRRILNENPGIGIIGPMSSAASTQSLPNYESSGDQTAINVLPVGLGVDDMNDFVERSGRETYAVRVPLVHGFCYGITRDVVDAIGYLDHESFPRGYGEENDYCFRASNQGFSLAVATDTYVFHSKSKSFVSDERVKLMNEGARAFRDKHGQKRIARSVETMKLNPYLQRLRKEAELLYLKQELNENRYTDEIVVSVNNYENDLRMSFDLKGDKLTSLNEEMIDWGKLRRKKYKKNLVSIIVLVYGQLELTQRCIKSIYDTKNSSNVELIVVNNGSTIETAKGLRKLKEQYPDIKLIQIERNLNFALGNNIGFQFASGESVVFLNNDTYVTDEWLDTMLSDFRRNMAIFAQPTLLYPDGSIQSSGVGFSPLNSLGYAVYAHMRMSQRGMSVKSNTRHVRAVTGACLLIKSKDYAVLKGFDPLYINGQEDVDLCLRASRLYEGKETQGVVSTAIIYHDESKAPGRGKYVSFNRRLYLKRWASYGGSLSDEEIYERDNYRVREWAADDKDMEIEGIAIYRPVLERSRTSLL
jgi:GT2 family glycosyltransferase